MEMAVGPSKPSYFATILGNFVGPTWILRQWSWTCIITIMMDDIQCVVVINDTKNIIDYCRQRKAEVHLANLCPRRKKFE